MNERKKKLLREALFILVTGTLLCLPLLKSGIAEAPGQDLLFHMYRLVGIKDTISDHQILDHIYPYANNGYGYASPLFYCDIFLYPFAVLYYLGMPLVGCYKGMLCVYSFLSVFLAYHCGKKILGGEKGAVLFTLFYSFSSYHLITQYTRAAFGEVLAVTFIPLVLLSFYELLVERKDCWVLLGISFALLLLSHVLSFALYCVLFAEFLVIFMIREHSKEVLKKLWFTTGKAILLALGLSAFYLFPMIEQMLSQKLNYQYLGSLYDIYRLNVPAAVLTPFAGWHTGEREFFSTVSMGVLLAASPLVYYLAKKRPLMNILALNVLLLLVMVSGVLPFNRLPLINGLQFSFRFYLLAFPLASILLSYALPQLKLKGAAKTVILIAAVILACLNPLLYDLQYREAERFLSTESAEELYDHSDLIGRLDYNQKQLSGAEYLPPSETFDYLSDPCHIKEILPDGQYNEVIYANEYIRYGTHIRFAYDSADEKTLMLPLTYYKGYQVYDVTDGKEKIDTFSVPEYYQVGFRTLPGNHEYLVYYNGTVIQKAALLLSAGCWLVFFGKVLRQSRM